ncbi:MAG: hypothetical protein JWM93_530 [Frankiales bacterium]|nr:hypothetical protein [Frankiales bacterium]
MRRRAAAIAMTIGMGVAVTSAIATTSAQASPPTADTAALQTFLENVQQLAGPAFTDVSVDLGTRTVDVSLSGGDAAAAQGALNRSLPPGVNLRFHAAAHPYAELLGNEDAVAASLRSQGTDVASVAVTADGHLAIGVRGGVATAQSQADVFLGKGYATVVEDDEERMTPVSLRYSDSSPWNGGDALNMGGSFGGGCTSGIPVHSTSTSTTYVLTAAHCWDGISSLTVTNYLFAEGYGSGATIGSRYKTDLSISNTSATDTTDSALINARSSNLVFNTAWNSSGKTTVVGTSTDVKGNQVCMSGAYEGEICGLTITTADTLKCPAGAGGCAHFSIADAPVGVVAVGEGDSGGAVYRYSGSSLLAAGMVDGESRNTVTCKNFPTGNTPTGTITRTCTDELWYIPIHRIMTKWAVTPNT